MPRSIPDALADGRYVLDRLLGEGASKRVYLARDTRLDREVAVAAIRGEGLDEAGRLRLQREAQAMVRLGDHPNVVTIHDVLQEDAGVYIVSQYMSGGDLDTRIGTSPDGRLTFEDSVAIATQICGALEHAHERGVVHRDLKPANVWLTDDGTAKLGDFDLALAADRTRLTSDGVMVGTVAYMPPEQALGRTPDARSDLYALGATLYEMVTGQPPFAGDDPVGVISQHINTPPVAPSWHSPGMPKPLEALILDLLAKDPESRPASVAVVAGRLTAFDSVSSRQPVGESGTNPLDRLASGVFVGREGELEQLRAGLDESLSGEVRVLMVAGESGIGKTRTCEELTTYGRMRSARVIWGRCHEGDGAPPFWPWVQIVRDYVADHEPHELMADFGHSAGDIAELVPDLREALPGVQAPPQLDPEQSRFRLFDSLTSFLRLASERAPLVLVLDDLHWADEPSLLLLQFVAREIGRARLLLVGTYRDVELRRQHPLAETLGEMSRLESLHRVTLRGLDAADVERFVSRTANLRPPPSLVEAVYRETEGNPFFVHEVVRLLTSEGRLDGSADARGAWSFEIPQGVREVIGRRLNQLSETCNQALTVGAVLGRSFDLAVLLRVGDFDQTTVLEAADEACGARVLQEMDDGVGSYRFSHALVRETLYEELPTPRREALHREAGKVLSQLHGAELGPYTAEIANHLFQSAQAGDPERSVQASERAADWARGCKAWEEVALHLERTVQVLEMMEERDPRRHNELVVALAEAQGLGREVERTRATATRGFEMARELDSASLMARAALAYASGYVVVEMGRVDERLVEFLETSVERLGNEDLSTRAVLLARLATELFFSGDTERIDALMEESWELAEKSGDPGVQAQAFLAFRDGIRPGDETRMAEQGQRLVELGRSKADASTELTGLEYVLRAEIWNGNAEAAREVVAEERRLADTVRTPLARFRTSAHEAMLALIEGRFDDAKEWIRGYTEEAGGSLGRNLEPIVLGQRTALSSQREGLEAAPDEIVELARRFSRHPLFRSWLCWARAVSGQTNEARRVLGELGKADFDDVPRDAVFFMVLHSLADATCELREPRYAAALYRHLVPHAGGSPVVGEAQWVGPVDLRLGTLAILLERFDAAEDHLDSAIDFTDRFGARPSAALSRLALAQLLSRRGDSRLAEARHNLDAALEIGRELGMQPLVRHALKLKVEIQGGSTQGETLAIDP
ncbi:MAG: protein kinase [Acidobacteriota bacterium]|nr:protein kinase [Acidobacteriota bacterium]